MSVKSLPGWQFVSRLTERKLVLVAVLVLLATLLAALFGGYLVEHDPQKLNVLDRLRPPSDEYILGTDHLGRDILSRIIAGSRISLAVGFASVVLSTVFGVAIGVLAGYFQQVDRVLMRIMDGFMAFPVILLAIALMAALGPTISNVVIALSIVYAPRTARIVRSTVLVVRETLYVDAAVALGASHSKIIVRHILPNCLSPIIVQATFTFAYAIQAEAALSFLGVGVPPTIPSWGIMLSESRLYMTQAPWMTIPPGVAIALVVLSLNAIGDGLRDFLDPRLRNG